MMISCGFLLQPERPLAMRLKRSAPGIRKRAKNLGIVLAGSTKAPRAEGEREMRAERLNELKEMAAKLLETARGLPPGQDRDNALREIARFPRADNRSATPRFAVGAAKAEGNGK
jgi:hypothetical protein